MTKPETRQRILVIEDDRTTSDTLRLYLENAGYEVTQAYDGETGLERASGRSVDLVVLDLMLPKLDGLSICRALRNDSTLGGAGSRLPILMLTARSDEVDRVRGLDLGADDYLVKPFSPRELVARVRAILRRSDAQVETQALGVGDLVIEPATRRASWCGEELPLTPTEFDLLATMAARPERVFRREQLIELVFGHDFEGTERAVDAHVKNLRRKIEATAPRLVHTVFGVGYRFALPNGGPGDRA